MQQARRELRGILLQSASTLWPNCIQPCLIQCSLEQDWQHRLANEVNWIERGQPLLGQFIQICAGKDAAKPVSRVEFPVSIDAAAAVGKPNAHQNQIRAMDAVSAVP